MSAFMVFIYFGFAEAGTSRPTPAVHPHYKVYLVMPRVALMRS
jgi:hypothetical protein